MKRTTFALLFLLALISCTKKLNDSPPLSTEAVSAPLSNSLTDNTVVVASTPPTSIPDDLTVSGPSGTSINIISSSDYNTLEPKDQIFYSGLNNAAEYLLQDETNLATTLQFNADGSYVITANTNPVTESPEYSRECYACNFSTAFSCMRQIAVDMIVHHSHIIAATISLKGGCLKISYGGYQLVRPNIGGSIVETYHPVPTYLNTEFNSYIDAVKFWGASHQGSGSTGGLPTGDGPISHPQLWTKEELVGYIKLYNQDLSHPFIVYQYDAEFQLQLEYYILYVMTDIMIPTPDIN